ncbi:putative ATPase/DNA-binding winged helix-turn-helix (wHTH) protein [Bradyrhizobium liaoningense]|uniref:ATP-binding protein n=2 Tax=Bradyrhizobium liaoningense TaxID=43992 RepID=UPI0024E158C4|nr:winged helix-turn-helix domain-containing protein [Bradyrhizobium liaoningense]
MMSSNTRASMSSDAIILFGDFQLDRRRRLLLKDGNPVRIGSRGLDILIALTDRAGEVVSKRDLLESVWNGVVTDEAGLRVHMSTLRRALGDGRNDARYIVNVAGRGYSFVAAIKRSHTSLASSSDSNSADRLGRQFLSHRGLFGGRDEVVLSISRLLASRRFVSIVGAGGIGKTAVAVALVARLRAEFGDENVAFVDFGAVLEPGLVPGSVISAVGCTLGGSDPVAELSSFLADKRMLVVFDSCEHLLDPISLLADRLFRDAPFVHLLTTSREPLHVEGETVHLLGPLAYPAEEAPTAVDALATPAVRLFMDRAAFSGFTEDLTDADAPIVSDICRRTDGIALAIELAASRVGSYGIRGVAGLLAQNAEMALPIRRNVSPRHRTLQAMLDWSYDLLAEDERRTLSRLSAFVGLFTMEAACSVAGEEESDRAAIASTLERLVDKSLVWVRPIDEAVYYRLPDTTRAYAAAKLSQSEDVEPIASRHARYFASLFKSLALEHGAYAEIGRHAPHLGNVRKALEWSFSSEENRKIGIELAADAAPLFLGLWLLADCSHWSRLALTAIQHMSEMSHREARLLEAFAVASMHMWGNTQEVKDAIQRGLDLYEAGEQGLAQLRLLAGLNLFLTRIGDFDGGLAAAERCKAVADRSGSISDRVISEWMLAAALHLAGHQADAIAHCELGFELEATHSRLDLNLFGYDHRLRAELALARSLWLRGAATRACGLAVAALHEAEGLSPPSNYCMAVVHAVPILLWNGETEVCAEHIDRAIVQAEKHSLKALAAAALALKGEWLTMTAKPAAGVETLRQALNLLYREQFRMLTSAAAQALADGLAQSGRLVEARTTIQTAISSAQKMGQKFSMPGLLRTQAQIIMRSADAQHDKAESLLRESINYARSQGALAWELRAALALARLLIVHGRVAETRALLEPVLAAHEEDSGSSDLLDATDLLARLA